MEQKRLNELVDALTNKGVNLPCPRCSHAKFSVVGESLIPIQEDPNAFSIGGPSIPTIIIACDNCGYISQHASAPLGVMRGSRR